MDPTYKQHPLEGDDYGGKSQDAGLGCHKMHQIFFLEDCSSTPYRRSLIQATQHKHL